MIDICFDECTTGETKLKLFNLAQCFDKENLVRQLPKKSKEIDLFFGDDEFVDSSNVHCLNLFLNIGNLDGDILDSQRQFFRNWFYFLSDGEFDDDWNSALEKYEKIVNAINANEPMRIWMNDHVENRCNFLYLCSLMTNYKGSALLLRSDIPMNETSETIIETSTVLTKDMILSAANEWDRLKVENKPLRILQDGKVIGVEDDFFDSLILRCAPKNKFNINKLIGEVISAAAQSAPHEHFLHQRIDKLILDGKFSIVSHINDPLGHPVFILKRNY